MENLTTKQLAFWLFLLAVLLQLPLVFNAGYFSHDELQWASRADVEGWLSLPWIRWFDLTIYQYRPLTFNLWLFISYWCFDTPQLFHGIFVCWGALNAVLLLLMVRPYGMAASTACLGSLLFVLNPYAVYVHGWVATLADLLVMTSLLLMVVLLLRSSKRTHFAIISGFFTFTALLSKESAIAIPAILAVAWLFDQRKAKWFISALVAGLVTLLYLVLRFENLLQPDADQYAMSWWNPPLRWLEYHWHWLILNSIEPHSLFARVAENKIIIAGVTFVLLLWACWRSHSKLTLLMLASGLAALLPVLPISSSSGQYGYLFSAVVVMTMVAISSFATGWRKYLMVFVALVSVVHGLKIMREIRQVGEVQSVFSPALAQIVKSHKGDFPIRLKVAPDAKKYIFIRMTKDIHSYQGVEIDDRVLLVEQVEVADYLVLGDGRIVVSD